MRHRKKIWKLSRTASHRKALLANLAVALFEKKHIQTTLVKAKATRQVAEKLITLAKNDTVHTRRLAFSRLRQRSGVQALFTEVAPQFIDRPGGYTRIIKLGQRLGDGSHMAILELVGFEMAAKKKKLKEDAKAVKESKKDKEKEKEKEAA